jgi:hypothetical protein
MAQNGLYALIILASITMLLTMQTSTWSIVALIAAIVISVVGIFRNRQRKS